MLGVFICCDVPGKGTIKKIKALTIIEKAMGWPEFIAICNKTCYHISLLVDSEWLCHYPSRPARVVYNNENDFVGQEFQEIPLGILKAMGSSKESISL
jgi:hypothetical protein